MSEKTGIDRLRSLPRYVYSTIETANGRVIDKMFAVTVTEAEALAYCYAHGFNWGGLYETFSRVSCWCCPLQPLAELRKLRHEFPELWARLRDMDAKSWNTFRIDYSVEQLERRFAQEDAQMSMFDCMTMGGDAS